MNPDLRSRLQRWWQTNIIDTHAGPPLQWQPALILCAATVLLTLFYYYGKSGWWYRSGLDDPTRALLPSTWETYFDMLPFVWWGVQSILIRVLVPCLLILWIYRESPLRHGLGLGDSHKHIPIYLGLYLFMLPFLVWASTLASFQNNYPFYDRAGVSTTHFVLFECFYALQFIGVEFFFRGFLLFTLFRVFGWYSLLIAAIPYVMIHFNKPIPETLGALVAGTILGYLALRTRSIWPGVLLHGGIALTMDLLAMWQKGAWS